MSVKNFKNDFKYRKTSTFKDCIHHSWIKKYFLKAFPTVINYNRLEFGWAISKKEDYYTWFCIWVRPRGNSVDLPDWFCWPPLFGPVCCLLPLLL